MDAVEQRILSILDKRAQEIIDYANDIYHHPEAGFKEYRTSDKTAEMLEGLGLKVRRGLSITGLRADIGEGEGPTVCVVGELDGIFSKAHPFADPETGISHACGHHMQLAAMMGAAIALSDPQVQAALGGKVAILAVPAEEHVPEEFAGELIAEGKVRACSGKSDLICKGELEDLDIFMTTHAHMVPCESDLLIGNNSSNGYIAKTIRMLGKASHAAIAPHNGINALDAAVLSLTALGMLRSTYQEKDYVRNHPIITKGGDAVNVVPEEVCLETQVRAKTYDAMMDASEKNDRAFRAGAMAFGAKVEITDKQGFLPIIPSAPIGALKDAAALLEGVSVAEMDPHAHNVASTDVGDLTYVKPVVNFTMKGFTGSLHGADFTITDENKAYIVPAKMMALTVYQLLKDGAAQAKEVVRDFKPTFTTDEYREYVAKFYR